MKQIERDRLIMGGYAVLRTFVWFASLMIVVQPESYQSDLEIFGLETNNCDVKVHDIEGVKGDMYFKRSDDGSYTLYANGEPWFDYSEEKSFQGHSANCPKNNTCRAAGAFCQAGPGGRLFLCRAASAGSN